MNPESDPFRSSAPEAPASASLPTGRTRWGLRLVMLLLCLVAPELLWAQGPPISGTAQLTLAPSPSSLVVGSTVQVSLTINLTSVTGMGPSGSPTPAVLGGYQVRVNFDRNLLQFDSAAGGSSAGYTMPPTSTARPIANSTGMVTVVAAQPAPDSPTGVVSVAVLTFTAIGPGTATLTADPTSLSSAFQPGPPPVGPTDIPGMGSSSNVTIAQDPPPQVTAASFFTVAPCRIVDTRNPDGPVGGPALDANTNRTFPITGFCGIPPTAKAVSINITVTQPSSLGDLRIYPAGIVLPLTSSMNYRGGQTRANNAIVLLGTTGSLSLRCVQISGSVHFILDVNGYFQ